MNAQNTALIRTAKPTVAGILNIIVGSLCLLGVLGLVIAAVAIVPLNVVSDLPFAVSVLLVIIAIPLAAVGSLSLVGGVFSLQRRMWGWALAGSIATLLVSNVFGIVSLILTALSKDEFVQ
jgi:hypothetical protein